jgi:uncharacterized protein YecE (DUF72 family)
VNIRIGTCGYSYPGPAPKGWHGVFYPAGKPRGFDELACYSSFFDTVEINSSFYRPPLPGMAEAWTRKTPPDFEFAVKAWQKFTHPTKLGEGTSNRSENWEQPTAADVESFKTSIAALADAGKLGMLLFQYPAGFFLTPDNADRLRWTLQAFHDYPKAVELRHRSWSDRASEVKALLAESKATWAVIDEPKFESSVRQSLDANGNIFYLRLHGRNAEKWWRHREPWERYDYLYGAEEIRALANKIKTIAQSSPQAKIYAFFNNHARAQAVVDGLLLKRELGLELPAPLPQTLVEAYPQLKGKDES